MTREEEEEGTAVDAVNARIREMRQALADALGDEEPEDTLPLLEPAHGSRDEGWWNRNVEPLRESVREYKGKLDRAESSHTALKAELEAVLDLAPERNR